MSSSTSRFGCSLRVLPEPSPDNAAEASRQDSKEEVPLLQLIQDAITTASEGGLVAFMRHGPKGPDGELTEEDRLAAFRFGATLPGNFALQINHSPVSRCTDTAKLILEGFLSTHPNSSANVMAELGMLATYDYFSLCAEKLLEYKKHHKGLAFLGNWIDASVVLI